ncbi:MAG TPA: hypothetical protein P5075_08215 [Eubacteriales bacterium]|nr:hypothetical protein [Eubacteriales bacterium]
MAIAKYGTLAGMIGERGIKRTVIAKRLGISRKTLSAKIRGDTRFGFEEAQIIRSEFFPDVPLERLFSVDRAGSGMLKRMQEEKKAKT